MNLFICIGAIVVTLIVCFLKQHLLKKRILYIDEVIKNVLSGESTYIYTNKNDTVSNLMFTINDLITAYHKQRQSFEKEQSTRKKLLSNLSHDVRTPLVSVIGYLEAVTQNRITSDKKTEYLETALQKSLILKNCINDLFEFVQIDANDITLKLEKHDICEILRQVIIDFFPYIEKENIKLETKIIDESVYVNLDELAITRIFQNLIRNTITHGKKGQYLGVFISLNIDSISIDIKDKGKGIDKEHLPYVFERLYKVDNARTNGGGLGLAIAKELTEKMNGTLEILHSVPSNTVVRISFPIIR